LKKSINTPPRERRIEKRRKNKEEVRRAKELLINK
jgi:hypothetical protein